MLPLWQITTWFSELEEEASDEAEDSLEELDSDDELELAGALLEELLAGAELDELDPHGPSVSPWPRWPLSALWLTVCVLPLWQITT